MKIIFYILTYNSSEVLSNCIDSVLQQVNLLSVDYEINILNNGSVDNTKDLILSKIGNINYFENKTNMSFTYGFNRLFSSDTDGDIYCMMSDDVILESDIVNYCIQYYNKPINLKNIIGPKSILPNGHLDRINKKELNEIDLLFGYTIIGTFYKKRSAEYNQNYSCNAEVLQDSCLFFSSLAKPFFRFDEKYKFYFTEDSLSISLRKAGFILRYETEIYVTHFLKQATKKVKNTKINTIYMKDCMTYSRYNSNPLFHFIIFLPLMILTFCIKYFKWVLFKEDYH